MASKEKEQKGKIAALEKRLQAINNHHEMSSEKLMNEVTTLRSDRQTLRLEVKDSKTRKLSPKLKSQKPATKLLMLDE
jgi:hypothetical protein